MPGNHPARPEGTAVHVSWSPSAHHGRSEAAAERSNPDNLGSLIDVSSIGSAETVRRKVQAYLDLGYDYLLLNASTPGMPERMRHDWLTRFARDVWPHLGEAMPRVEAAVA